MLYHGGLAPRFGVETLIRAFERLRTSVPRLELRVCGSGEDRDRLAALATEIDPQRIDIAADPVPFAQIPAELEAAHIGVVPTLHDRFTELLLPVKLLEYEPGDPQALARAIESICDDPRSACERAERATARLQELAWEKQRERYLGLVDELTGCSASSTRPRRGVGARVAA